MSLAIADFWKLLEESRLFSAGDCQKVQDRFAQVKGADTQGNTQTLLQWLVSARILTRYQATVLAGGRPGPFIFGNYKVVDRIGDGRLNGLFRAIHRPTRHPVCLYFLTGDATQDPDKLSIAAAQIAAARRAESPHLSGCHELVDLGKYKLVALENLAGQSLAERLASQGRLNTVEACAAARDVAGALACLHELGQVHGAVRADNVWFDASGAAKLLQVPLARDPLAALAPLDFSNALQPEADYAAPELAYPGRLPDAQTDIYALGCTLYQMLSGNPPFPGGDLRQKLARHATERIEPLEPLGVPQPLAVIVAYMMAKDHERRYRQASTVAEALTAYAPRLALREAESSATATAYETWLIENSPLPKPTPIKTPPPITAESHLTESDTDPAITAIAAAIIPDRPLAAVARPARRKNRSATHALIGGGVALALAAVAGLLFAVNRDSDSAKPPHSSYNSGESRPDFMPPPDPQPKPNAIALAGPTLEKDEKQSPATTGPQIVEDDGQSLWVSPTSGPPLDLKLLPAGTKAVIALRPAELLASPEGEKIQVALGPLGQTARAWLETACGTNLANIDQLLIALYDGPNESQSIWLVVELRKPITKEEVQKAWSHPIAAIHNSHTYYQSADRAYYPLPNSNEKKFAVGPAATIKHLIDRGDNLPPLALPIEKLLASSDSHRHVSICIMRGTINESAPALAEPAAWLLGNDTRAVLLSLHWADDFFAELRIDPDLVEPRTIAQQYHQRLRTAPDQIESYLASRTVHPYGRKLLARLPRMLYLLEGQTRSAVERRHAVLRSYLPPAAGHNLLMATELALADRAALHPADAPKAPSDQPQSVAEKLKKTVSLVFVRDTLEKSMEMLSAEVGVPIEILGSDLQLDGITKNQSFGLSERDRPADEILRKIVLKANPDGKLVYVIKPKEPGGEEMIFITTRAAAAKRGDKLPPELAAANKK